MTSFYWKTLILRKKFFFDSSRFYHIFLFVLNCSCLILLGSCFNILNMFRKSLKDVTHYPNHMRFWYLVFHSIHLLILWGDVEQITEPKDRKYFSLCHRNLNSLAAHKLDKVNTVRETQREKTPSNKVLTKSINFDIRVVVTSN